VESRKLVSNAITALSTKSGSLGVETADYFRVKKLKAMDSSPRLKKKLQ
jgi:hypothetical protein